jgi:hypothetical protein
MFSRESCVDNEGGSVVENPNLLNSLNLSSKPLATDWLIGGIVSG